MASPKVLNRTFIATVALSAFILGNLSMDNHAAAIDLTASAPNLGVGNPTKKLVCKARVVSRGGGKYYPYLINGTYMAQAREQWRQDVTNRYGAGFSQWSLAHQRRGACTESAGTRFRIFVCSVGATPCQFTR